MPAYAFDFVTATGAQRLQFTLDDDRPLAPQLFQVLEELRQRELIIRGGPDEEVGAFWQSIDLDQTKTPQQLGLSPARPIELRMRRAPAKKPRAVEPPIVPFVAKGGAVAALAGFFGALIAWAIAASFVDLGDIVDDYAQLDGVVAIILGTCVGAAALGAAALRESSRRGAGRVALDVLLGTAIGAALGMVGGALGAVASSLTRGALAGSSSAAAFVGARVGAWALLGAALGVLLAVRYVRRDPRRLVDGLLAGLVAGALGGLVYCFPGPSDIWQLTAFLMVGAGIAAGLAAPALQRSAAILELESRRSRRVGALGLREWGLDESTDVSLQNDASGATVSWKGGRFAILPAAENTAPVVVSGEAVRAPIYLRNGDVIDLGDARFRFRRLRSAAS
jgi:hypothetical protein